MPTDLAWSLVASWIRAHVTVTNAANVASIISLGLTIWVTVALRRIKASYLFRARVPELARRLKRHSSQLCNCLNDREAFIDKIAEELAAAEVTSQSLQRKLDGEPRRAVKTLVSAIRRCAESGSAESDLRNVYVQMIKVGEQLKDQLADLRWEQ